MWIESRKTTTTTTTQDNNNNTVSLRFKVVTSQWNSEENLRYKNWKTDIFEHSKSGSERLFRSGILRFSLDHLRSLFLAMKSSKTTRQIEMSVFIQ